jgi:hypothetical protein
MKTIRGILSLAMILFAGNLLAAVYEVGPGKTFSTIGQVPWETLQPGDTVLIHARPEPYREKWVIARAGTADKPITVRGVPDANGNLPVIAADGATTRTNLDFWSEGRSVIKIGGARGAGNETARHIVVENLDVRGARPPHTFTDAHGKTQTYLKNAASIRIESAESVTIRNCALHDSGNGLFVSSSDDRASRDIRVEGNRIFDNGIEKSGMEHNVYSAAIGIIFQANRFGPLRTNCLGNNLKDRSAGLVVRANWIEGGNQELDFVDAEDSALVRRDARYGDTLVEGNIFLKLKRDNHPFLVHYGGDSATPGNYRKGTLHFLHNTIVSYRTGQTILFRVSTDAERVDCRDNIFFATASGDKVVLLDNHGQLEMGRNWLKPGWKISTAKEFNAAHFKEGQPIEGDAPGFVDFAAQDFHLTTRARESLRELGAVEFNAAQ